MTTTWYVVGPLVVLTALVGVAVLVKPDLLHWRLSPTQPQDPGDDDREASGADEQYPEELAADKSRERELRAIADEYDLTLISPVGLATAEDILALRRSFAELVDHCAQRVNAIIDDFAPGWWEETAVVPLPSFGAVHALIDDTSEFEAVTV